MVQLAGDLLLVLFTIMASALLSASFALFLVRERESSSKSVQMISGTPPSVFWLSNFLFDILAFSVPAAGNEFLSAYNLWKVYHPSTFSHHRLGFDYRLQALLQNAVHRLCHPRREL